MDFQDWVKFIVRKPLTQVLNIEWSLHDGPM